MNVLNKIKSKPQPSASTDSQPADIAKKQVSQQPQPVGESEAMGGSVLNAISEFGPASSRQSDFSETNIPHSYCDSFTKISHMPHDLKPSSYSSQANNKKEPGNEQSEKESGWNWEQAPREYSHTLLARRGFSIGRVGILEGVLERRRRSGSTNMLVRTVEAEAARVSFGTELIPNPDAVLRVYLGGIADVGDNEYAISGADLLQVVHKTAATR